ncbi:hypothetical protein [uncultured Paraglaciecola sp.]|uniref:hypothetical protein n=1 Tax=uncultured Paraglaciecola sp. TaxID=1765024 RepID=UPI002617EDAB|nr:hypothetical protein [uncultured Paraglaciecola sp.]
MTGTRTHRADITNHNTIGFTSGINIGNIGSRTRTHWRQTCWQYDVRLHIGKYKPARCILYGNSNLEEFFKGFDTTIDDDDSGDSLSCRCLDHDYVGAAGNAAGDRPWSAARDTSTAGSPSATTARAAITNTRRCGYRNWLTVGDRKLTDGDHDGKHRNIEVARVIQIYNAVFHQQLGFFNSEWA